MQNRKMRFRKYPPTNVGSWYKIDGVWNFDPIIHVVNQILSKLNCILDNHNGRCYLIIRLSWRNSISITLCLPKLTSQDDRALGVQVASRQENGGNIHWRIHLHSDVIFQVLSRSETLDMFHWNQSSSKTNASIPRVECSLYFSVRREHTKDREQI